MPGEANRLRAVVYEKAFEDQVAEFRTGSNPSRIDDVLEGVDWAVATRDNLEEVADPIDFGDQGLVFVIKTDPAPPSVPALRMFFTLSEGGTRVHMRHLEEDPNYSDIG